MGLQDVTSITDYDFIVAVTERAINVGLDAWLSAQDATIALYYNKDSNGNYVAADSEANATIIFTGTLAPTLDTNRKPIDLITLFVSEGSRTVQYNLTITGGAFQASSGTKYKQTRTDPWVIHFNVDLSLASIAFNDLPADVQGTFANASLFSYQQLGLDLSTAVFDSLDNVDALDPTSNDGADFTGVLAAYLKQQQSNAAMIFGLTACANSNNEASTPTISPTAIDFCISQYSGSDPAGHALDTLNYLAVTGGRTLPPTPTTSFGFNWVDSLDEMGAIGTRRDLIAGIVVPLLNNILPTLSPKVHVDPKGDNERGDIKLLPCDLRPPPTFTDNESPGKQVANYSYDPGEADKTDVTKYGLVTVKGKYASSCDVYVGFDSSGDPNPQDKLTVYGACTFDGSIALHSVISAGEEVPATTYFWYVVLQMQMDLNNVGQLNFTVSNSNFDSPPIVNDPHQSTWDRILETLSGNMKDYVNDISGVGQTLQNQLPDIVTSLQGVLVGSSAQFFVFPGSQSFLFSNPQFTPNGDLVANVNYYQATSSATTGEEATWIRSKQAAS